MSTPPNVSIAFTAEDRGMAAAFNTLSTNLTSLAAKQQALAASAHEAAAGEEELTYSMHEAKGAAALLGEEVGVNLNRHLRSVLASSSTLGPILQAAFPVAAALGFAEVIAHATEKLTEWVSETFIFTEAMKEMDKTAAAESAQLVALAKAHGDALHEQELAGKTALEQAAMRKAWTDADAAATKSNIENQEKERVSLTQTIALLKTAREAELAKPAENVAPESFAIESPDVTGIDKQIAEAQDKLNKLPVGQLGQAQLQASVDQQKAAQQKITEALNEEQSKREKAQQESDARLAAEFARYLETEQRAADSQRQFEIEEAAFEEKELEREQLTRAKAQVTMLEADIKFSEAQVANKEKAQVDAIALQQKHVEQLATQGKISGEQELEQLRQLAQKKLDVENQYLDARLAEITARINSGETGEAYAKDLAAWTTLLDQKRAANDKYNSEVEAADAAAEKHLTGFAAAQKSITQDLTSFFTSGINQARSFSDAMANLAKSIIADLQKMAAEYVITAIKQKLLGAAGGGGGASPLGSDTSGGGLGSVLGLAFASGGPVSGPGGPKSDVIPAMLSSGEYVLNADAVKALGMANLDKLNMASAVPHLASGGFVGGGGQATTNEISMGIGLDEGLILRHLGSKAAGRVILQQLTNNSKGAQRALSRTD